MNFVLKISQKRNEQSSSNSHSIFALMRNGYNNLLSLITQPWRHLGAILWFHFIIHICITIHHKLTKFNTHELPAIVWHTSNPRSRARHNAHVRAHQNFHWWRHNILRYLAYQSSIFSEILICCSWDNSLQEKWH